ncbi:MAG: HEAT repeat domain-containing protein [Planctomycetota bacterium]
MGASSLLSVAPSNLRRIVERKVLVGSLTIVVLGCARPAEVRRPAPDESITADEWERIAASLAHIRAEHKRVIISNSLANIRPEINRVVDVLIDQSKPMRDRLAYAADQRVDVRRQVLNEVMRLRHPKFQKAANMRTASASDLGYVAPMEQETVDALVHAVETDEKMVRVFACQALGMAELAPGTDMGKALAVLLAAVDERDASEEWSVARTAVRALGRLRHTAARSRIVRLVKDHSANVQVAWCCAEALVELGGADDVVLDAVHVALGSKNWNLRHFAARAVKKVSSEKAVPFLVHHLAGEMELAVEDLRSHSVGDRVLQGLIGQLEHRTGQKFGADVNRWIEWFEANAQEYPQWTTEPPRGVGKELSDAYRSLITSRRFEVPARSDRGLPLDGKDLQHFRLPKARQ